MGEAEVCLERVDSDIDCVPKELHFQLLCEETSVTFQLRALVCGY